MLIHCMGTRCAKARCYVTTNCAQSVLKLFSLLVYKLSLYHCTMIAFVPSCCNESYNPCKNSLERPVA